MRVADWQTLSAQLEEQMRRVRRVFNELIGDDEAQSPDEQLEEYWRELWQGRAGRRRHYAGAGAP